MEIWLLTYLFILNGIETNHSIPMTESVCLITKVQLEFYKYKDAYPFQGIKCEQKEN